MVLSVALSIMGVLALGALPATSASSVAATTPTIANLGALPPVCARDSGAEGSGHICRRTNEVFTITSSAYSWRNDGGNNWTLLVDLNLSFPDVSPTRPTLYWAAVSDDRAGYNPYTRDGDPNHLTFFGDLQTYDGQVDGTSEAVYQHCINRTVCHLEYQDVPFAGTQGQPFYLPLTVQRLFSKNGVPPYQIPYCTCANTSWDIQRDHVLLSVIPHPDNAAPPTAAFTAKLSGNAAHQWDFDGSTSHGSAAIASYRWTFGDGTSTTTTTPTTRHTYSNGTDHTASLVVVDTRGTVSPAVSHTLTERAPVVNSTGDAAAVKPRAGCDTGAVVGSPAVPECTLRAAIQAVDAGGGDSITFAIPGSATPVIHPSTPLPDLVRSVVVDGTSQPGTGRVALDGSGAGSNAVGLHLTGGTSTVQGFVVNAFKTAIQADGGSGHQIIGNRIGTDLAGTAVGVPGEFGVVTTTPSTRIGGSGAQANVLLATQTCLAASGPGTQIIGNSVGVGADGSTPLAAGNALAILAVGPRARISGNTVRSQAAGIAVLGAGATGAQITSNHVGTTRDGTGALVMHGYGIRIDGAPGASVTGNVVATQASADISVSGSKQYTIANQKITFAAPSTDASGRVTGGDTVIRGNTIGLLRNGTSAGPGAAEGVWSWAGAGHVTIDGNTIAGQYNTIVELDAGSGHVVTGNYLGVSRTGAAVHPTQEGINLVGTTGARIGGSGSAANVIGGAHDAGIFLSPGSAHNSSTTIAGNWVGVSPGGAALGNDTGIKVRAADHTTIGPDNVIGHSRTGITVGAGSTTTLITGNRIGTRGTAATSAPNVTGIRIGDGDAPVPDATTVGPDNVVSANQTGVVSSGTKTRVARNRIGTAATTDDPVPNVAAGLQVLGGDLRATGNTIAYDKPGVDVAPAARVGLHANRLFGNDTAAIVHPAAPQAPKLLAAIRTTRGTTTRTLIVITGLPQGDAGTVEVFANSTCDEPQARYVLSLTKVKAARDTFLLINMIGRVNRNFLTVDYTDATGNTSALSDCRVAGRYPDADADGSPDVLEELLGQPGSSHDPTQGIVYTDKDQILRVKTDGGHLSGLGAADDPSPLTHPKGLILPFGLINFEIRDLAPSGVAIVTVTLVHGTQPLGAAWAKFGKVPSGATTWYNFSHDDFTGTGAETISKPLPGLVLRFVDGARGDDDGQRNGVIRDPGGPAVFAAPTTHQHGPGTPRPTAPSSASSTHASLAGTGQDLAAKLRAALLLLAFGCALASWRRHHPDGREL